MKVSDEDPRPRYAQIADDLRRSIVTGSLVAGEQLPAARELAERYGVAPMTAQKAIDVLKSEGMVFGAVGRGTFVRATEHDAGPPDADSPDFTRLMSQIEDLRTAVREQMSHLDQRLSNLEEEFRRSRRPER